VPVALDIQHEKRMHRIIFLSVAYLGLSYFSTLSHKWYDFWKNVFEYKICVFIFSAAFI
jgi:hypothetical protein